MDGGEGAALPLNHAPTRTPKSSTLALKTSANARKGHEWRTVGIGVDGALGFPDFAERHAGELHDEVAAFEPNGIMRRPQLPSRCSDKIAELGSARRLLVGLEQRGFIRRLPSKARANEVFKPVATFLLCLKFAASHPAFHLAYQPIRKSGQGKQRRHLKLEFATNGRSIPRCSSGNCAQTAERDFIKLMNPRNGRMSSKLSL